MRNGIHAVSARRARPHRNQPGRPGPLLRTCGIVEAGIPLSGVLFRATWPSTAYMVARNKPEWNLEPSRPYISNEDSIAKGCNNT